MGTERTEPEQDQKLYDYVICGYAFLEECFISQDSDIMGSGGTAGCVLASRLAENPDLSILLVEAGPPNETVPASAMPAGFVLIKIVPNNDRGADFCSKGSPDLRLGGRLEHQRRSFSPVE